MTATPHIHQALNDTVQDLRALGEAAKTDLRTLKSDAQALAHTKVIEPGVQLFKDTTQRLEHEAMRSKDAAKLKIEQMREFAVENPGRALVGALASGVVLGLLLRR